MIYTLIDFPLVLRRATVRERRVVDNIVVSSVPKENAVN
jgi:hypothetical protein